MAPRNTMTTSRFGVLAPALAVTALLALSACGGEDDPRVAGGPDGAAGDAAVPPASSAPPPNRAPTRIPQLGNKPTALPSKKPTSTPAVTPPPSQGAKPVTGNATLSWNPPTERTDGTALSTLSGYRIVYGTQSRNYRHSIRLTNPGITRYYIDGLSAATWYFAIIAVDAQGKESSPSLEVSKKIG